MDGSGNWLSDNAWMAKTDTAGNVISQIEEAHATYSGFAYASPVADGFIVQLGVCTPTDGNEDSIFEVRKYDNDGNLKWSTPLGVPGHRNQGGPLIATQDGGAIQVLNVIDTVSQDSSFLDDPSVIYKLDSNGHILWEYWFVEGSDFCSIAETRSGSIVLVENSNSLGFTNIPYSPNLVGGDFWKFDKNGNLIWSNWFISSTLYDSYFYDVTEAADGGIVAIGQATDSATGHQATWLVKVDSNGCMNGDCPTLYTGITDISAEQGWFMVFPSPAGVQYTVAVTETAYMQQYHDLAFRLYDLTGRMVYEQPLTDQATTIPRGDLPTGMYIWHISDGGRNLSNGKIVMK
ncbi:unnamed protein product [Sphagnum jensenii]|uniref:Secretion system C-terminal sorting domain-containing protein n=1 Tax=Sphagnum jensenii TaxID=128206 RepID=A0ABP0VA97_9BRYO